MILEHILCVTPSPDPDHKEDTLLEGRQTGYPSLPNYKVCRRAGYHSQAGWESSAMSWGQGVAKNMP